MAVWVQSLLGLCGLVGPVELQVGIVRRFMYKEILRDLEGCGSF